MRVLRIFILFSFYLISCNNQPPESTIPRSRPVEIDSYPAECPYLTHDTEGNIAMSWVRTGEDGKTTFCYAISKDEQTFSTPVIVPNTGNIQPHGENLPKIVFKSPTDIIALWGEANPNKRNKYSGRVYYSQSFDRGQTWTAPTPLTNDASSFDQRYYDVAVLPNGEVGAIWLDNPNDSTKPGSNLYFASTDGKQGFTTPRSISSSCCQCCRTVLYVDRQQHIHALFRGIIHDSIRDMVHMVSTDQAKTFSKPTRISDDNWVINGCPHTGPAMTENKYGLHFSWFTGGKNKGCYYTNSKDGGNHFNPRDSVSSLGSHPQITALKDGNLLTAWDESRTKDTTISKVIGVELRNESGERISREYITSTSDESSFPVLAQNNTGYGVVAYTIKKAGKNHIEYQLLNLNAASLKMSIPHMQ
ncbi:MAG TPA: sialidase family protein [Flavitalea sp.]|nr:sialidase family protein [Flavitalea sp.]